MTTGTPVESTFFVSGAAGFIGSNLVDGLLASGEKVIGCHNFSTGRSAFLQSACKHANFRLVEGDNLGLPGLALAMQGCDHVVHFVANADVRFGTDHPPKDYPFIYLDSGKIRRRGWTPEFGTQQSVEATIDWLHSNRWVFDHAESVAGAR